MQLTEEELAELISYKNKPNEDVVRYKEIIKQKLLENNKLIYLLDNKELNDVDAENDEYFNVNILPYYCIPDTQTHVANYLCYETYYEKNTRFSSNPAIKKQEIIFYILCHEKGNYVKEVGCARHDLIAALLIDEFNGTNIFGNQFALISDKPSTTDTHYSTRTLIFEQLTTNSLTKSNGKTFNLR